MKLTIERLTGMIAGVFALRAFDVGLSAFGQLALPVGHLADRLPLAAPSLTGAFVCGLIGYAYLRARQPRWLHIVAIVLLALGIVYGGFMAVTPVFIEMPNVGVSGPMVARGIVAILFCGVTIWMITKVMKESRAEQRAEPGATDNPDSAGFQAEKSSSN